MNSALFKTKASSIGKLAELPRYRHPADLINEEIKPMKQQYKLLNGQEPFGKGLYGNDAYEALVKNLLANRKGISQASDLVAKSKAAESQISEWNSYLTIKVDQLPQQQKINQQQKNHIYESIIITKERNEERLTLNRFVSFFNQYARGFKFDIAFHPLILMRLVYPHWGYLNLYPSIPAYRLTLEEVSNLFQELIVASNQRQSGNSLHSSELMGFIFWKLYTRKFSLSKPSGELSQTDFCQLLSYFKFKASAETLNTEFKYTLNGSTIAENQKINFDLWRKIYLERDL